MSIRAVDNQISVTRMTEMAKDNSAQIKKNELIQDYLAVQGKETDNQERHIVIKTGETEKAEIHPDKNGNEQRYSSSAHAKRKHNSGDDLNDILVAPDPNDKHIIDITI